MFIIKKHYEATESNTNFKGEVKDYYEGKGTKLLGEPNQFPLTHTIKEYGYSTLSGAKRGLKKAIESAELETHFGRWKVTVELIEVKLSN